MYVIFTLAHSCLHHLWIVYVHRVCAAYYVLNAEPVCYAYDGAKVARVLHAVGHECQLLSYVVDVYLGV